MADTIRYDASFKTTPMLKAKLAAFAKKLNTTEFPIAVVIHEDVTDSIDNLASLITKVAPHGKMMHASRRTIIVQLRLESSKDLRDIDEIAALDQVFAIELLPTFQASLNHARQIMQIDEVQWKYPSPTNGRYLGHNQVIAIADSGLDDGSMPANFAQYGTTGTSTDKYISNNYKDRNYYDPGNVVNNNTTFPRSPGHPAFAERVIGMTQFRPEGTGVIEPLRDSASGHGTFIAGCASSNPAVVVIDPQLDHDHLKVLGPGERPSERSAVVQGAAPKAKLFIIAFGWEPGMTNLEELFTLTYRAADGTLKVAPINNNSWNSVHQNEKDTQLGYGYLMGRKVDVATWGDPSVLVMFSAGNDGCTYTDTGAQIGGVASAKNCITVGATRNERPTEADHRAYHIQGEMADLNDLADFSNRGPTVSGRMKPDVVAPGACILAPRSLVKKGGKDENDLLDDKRYTISSGTSVSAPLVSGCAAILRQAYMEKNANLPPPSAALLKALIINGATDLEGHSAWICEHNQDRNKGFTKAVIPKAPNGLEGHGRVNLDDSLRSIVAVGTFHGGTTDNISIALGEEVQVATWVSDEPSDINVTLAWTDPPGEAMQQYFTMRVVNKPLTKPPNNLVETYLVDETQEWRYQDGSRPKKPGENSMPVKHAENNVQRARKTNAPAGLTEVYVTCVRTYRELPSATCVIAWSVVPTKYVPPAPPGWFWNMVNTAMTATGIN